jgi:hypothetical protein
MQRIDRWRSVQEARPPLVLLGAARSGTSLLYKALCLHPEAAWISNWACRYPHLLALSLLNRLTGAIPGAQLRLWFGQDSNAYVYGRRRASLERVFPHPVEGESIFVRSGLGLQTLGGAPGSAVQHDLRAAFEAIRRYGGGRCVVTKRIAHNRRVPALLAAFPHARFINLVRDGRAVAYSLSRVDWWQDSIVWWYGGTPQQWVKDGRDPWDLCSRNWMEELAAIDAGLSVVPPEQVMRISYEDFVRRPLATLAAVAGFAGLKSDATWSRQLDELTFPDMNEGWRRALQPNVVRRIEAIQQPVLQELGYVT